MLKSQLKDHWMKRDQRFNWKHCVTVQIYWNNKYFTSILTTALLIISIFYRFCCKWLARFSVYVEVENSSIVVLFLRIWTGLSMNILRLGDKSPMQRGFFTNSAGDLLSALRFLGELSNLFNFVIIFSLM